MSTAEEQLAMGEWAEATGGEAYYNSNDLVSLIAKAVDKGANYYTLSYVPHLAPNTMADTTPSSLRPTSPACTSPTAMSTTRKTHRS